MAELFGWYEAGTVTVPSADERWSFRVDERSAQMLREVLAATARPGVRTAPVRPNRFDDPVIIPGSRVTHLRYAVRRTGDRPGSPST